MRRAELRHYLRTLQGRWVEDPTNDDASYDRVRMRRLLATLEAEGLGVERLAATASRMARAKDALTARALSVWAETGREGQTSRGPTGDILFARSGFEAVEQDTRMRLLAAALQFVSTTHLPTPRRGDRGPAGAYPGRWRRHPAGMRGSCGGWFDHGLS